MFFNTISFNTSVVSDRYTLITLSLIGENCKVLCEYKCSGLF